MGADGDGTHATHVEPIGWVVWCSTYRFYTRRACLRAPILLQDILQLCILPKNRRVLINLFINK